MKIQKECQECKCIIISNERDIRKRNEKYNRWSRRITRYIQCPICKEELVLHQWDEDIKTGGKE